MIIGRKRYYYALITCKSRRITRTHTHMLVHTLFLFQCFVFFFFFQFYSQSASIIRQTHFHTKNTPGDLMKSRAAEWGGGITLKSEWELSQINECTKAAAVDSFEETVHFLFINILSSHPFCLSCYSIFTHTRTHVSDFLSVASQTQSQSVCAEDPFHCSISQFFLTK